MKFSKKSLMAILLTPLMPSGNGLDLNDKIAARATRKLIDPDLCDRSSPAI
jgi:hypothetical protein